MTKLVLLDAGPEGRVVWELEITDFYANQNGSSNAHISILFSFQDGSIIGSVMLTVGV